MALGFSLIEILISLLLLSILMMGFEATSLYAVREIREAYFLSYAQNQMASLADYVRAHQLRVSPDFLENWNQQNKDILPKVTSQIIEGETFYKVELCWKEQNNCLRENIYF